MILGNNNLPIFHCYYAPPTEDQLERVIERMMDAADKAFMLGKCTSDQYEAWCAALDMWSTNMVVNTNKL